MAIRGEVESGRAFVPIILRLAGNPNISLEFQIDTGFQGHLTLPPAAIAALNLPQIQSVVTRLADGSRLVMNAHQAVIIWQGVERGVQVLSTGNRPLLGAALLDGNLLTISYEEGGMVSIAPLATPAP